MRSLVLLLIAALLTGCGGPSTPLAPDVPMPDTSKMTGEEMLKAKNGG